MVLLASAIFSKDGKPILSRQFVEMSRSRIEGLLTAFPKLIGTEEKISDKNKKPETSKQHTFVETESVRYVYQPLEKLYVLLLTTKASNILEDLETLRLFAKVIPEYSRSLDEYDVKENIFDIINAFDEIVALGYKEHVNLAQIRTFTEMDSHEEKVFLAVRENQVRETKEKMRKKAIEIKSQRDAHKSGYGSGYGNKAPDMSLGSFSSQKAADADLLTGYSKPSVSTNNSDYSSKSSRTGGKAMRLGAGPALGSTSYGSSAAVKAHVVDSFVEQLKAEGVSVVDNTTVSITGEVGTTGRTRQISNMSGGDGTSGIPGVMENIHVRFEEKFRVLDHHNSGLDTFEINGILTLLVGQSDNNYLQLKVGYGKSQSDLQRHIQPITHPNIDRKTFLASQILQPKALNKPFPVGQDIGLLKWHLQTSDENFLPLKINCWPSKSAQGCSVVIEYELKNTECQLDNVVISIPLPTGSGEPSVRDYDGEYNLDAAKTHLQWTHEMIDNDCATGSMEFDTKSGKIEDFFPIVVHFSSTGTYTGIKIEEILDSQQKPTNFSSESSFYTDEYKIQ